MTNEELARAIQTGDRDKLLELWGLVERFAHWRAIRWERALGSRAGVTVEDLMQVAFLALLNALERWDPERGTAFTTYFGTSLKNAFAAACGVRTTKMEKDPLHSAVSLDMPADPSIPDGGTVGTQIPDPSAAQTIQDVENRIWREQLRKVLDTVLAELPADQAELLHRHYYAGETLRHIGADLGVAHETVRLWEKRAFRALRCQKDLWPFV